MVTEETSGGALKGNDLNFSQFINLGFFFSCKQRLKGKEGLSIDMSEE